MVWILFRHSFLSLQEGVWNRDFEINISPSINHHGQNDVLWKGGFFKPSLLNWTSFYVEYVLCTYIFCFIYNFAKPFLFISPSKKLFILCKKSHVKMSLVFPIGKIFSNKSFSQILKKKIDISKNVKLSAVFRRPLKKFLHVHISVYIELG